MATLSKGSRPHPSRKVGGKRTGTSLQAHKKKKGKNSKKKKKRPAVVRDLRTCSSSDEEMSGSESARESGGSDMHESDEETRGNPFAYPNKEKQQKSPPSVLSSLQDEEKTTETPKEAPAANACQRPLDLEENLGGEPASDAKNGNDEKDPSAAVEVRQRVRARENQVVFVDGIKNPEQFTNVDVRDELDKFFPEKAWRAYFMRNKGLRISGFKWQEDVDLITTIDWNTYFGDKGKPFGGCVKVTPRVAIPRETLMTDVCLAVLGKVDCEKLARRLEQDGYVGVEVVWSGKVTNPNWYRMMRLRMQTGEQRDRIILRGVRVGSTEDYACSWIARSKERRCFNCQSRGAHSAKDCRRQSVCPRCAGAHLLANCSSNVLKCAACSGTHAVWSEKCPVFVRRLIAESERIGVPHPPFWAGVRLDIVRRVRPEVIVPNQFSARVSSAKGTFAQRAGGQYARPQHALQQQPSESVQNLRRGGGSYKNGGMVDVPAQRQQSQKVIEENVTHKVVSQGVSILRRFLTTLVAEVQSEIQVRSENSLQQEVNSKGEKEQEKRSESGNSEHDSKVDQSEARSFLDSHKVSDSTLNLVAVLMRSLLKVLGPHTPDEDDDELEEGEISQLLSRFSLQNGS